MTPSGAGVAQWHSALGGDDPHPHHLGDVRERPTNQAIRYPDLERIEAGRA